jgi:integrase/recombinase XerD
VQLVQPGRDNIHHHALNDAPPAQLSAVAVLIVAEAGWPSLIGLSQERGHRTLTVTRKGGKVVTIPLAPRTARAIDLAVWRTRTCGAAAELP